MKADVSYNDLVGTAAADITDFTNGHNELADYEKLFKLDKTRFDLVGISLYGSETPSLSLICVDKELSTENKEHIVSMSIDDEFENVLDMLFKRLHIVLYKKFDEKYSKLDYDQEVSYEDFHEEEES